MCYKNTYARMNEYIVPILLPDVEGTDARLPLGTVPRAQRVAPEVI